jgi:hypothetical protein
MRITITELAYRTNRSVQSVRNWKRRGCPGFELVNGRLYANFETVQQWRVENDASKPGRKGKRMSIKPLCKEVAFTGNFVDCEGRKVTLTEELLGQAIEGTRQLLDAGFNIRGYSSHFTDDSKDVMGTWLGLWQEGRSIKGVFEPIDDEVGNRARHLDTSMVVEEAIDIGNGVIVPMAITRVDLVGQGAVVGTEGFREMFSRYRGINRNSQRTLMFVREAERQDVMVQKGNPLIQAAQRKGLLSIKPSGNQYGSRSCGSYEDYLRKAEEEERYQADLAKIVEAMFKERKIMNAEASQFRVKYNHFRNNYGDKSALDALKGWLSNYPLSNVRAPAAVNNGRAFSRLRKPNINPLLKAYHQKYPRP